MANHLGTRWRGKLPVPAKAHPLVRQLVRILNNEQTTITEVADRAGLRRGTISTWRYRHTPHMADFEAALNALGYELKIEKRRDEAERASLARIEVWRAAQQ